MSIYQNIFDLIHTYVYGGVDLTAEMELVNVLLSSCACIFLVALPFLVVWKLITVIVGR